jgi:hypothetical protein
VRWGGADSDIDANGGEGAGVGNLRWRRRVGVEGEIKGTCVGVGREEELWLYLELGGWEDVTS